MSDRHEREARVTLVREGDFRFRVRVGDRGTVLITDEPPPLGGGSGPDPSELLATAVGSCLGASLLFCLRKARIAVGELEAEVHGTVVRDPGGRLRIGELRATLAPTVAAGEWQRMDRCLDVFESFCMVTESVRHGIPILVSIEPREPGHEAPVPRGESLAPVERAGKPRT
jgi:uncharacterized OsmC-like protein